MKSQRDEMILGLSHACTQILKGWHALRLTDDTPSGLIINQIDIYNHFTPSEFLFGHSSFDRVLGYGLNHEDAFQNMHLGMLGKN